MRNQSVKLLTTGVLIFIAAQSFAQQDQRQKAKPEDTEVWEPVPEVVVPGASFSEAPSDALILFDGSSLDQWVTVKDGSPAKWTLEDGVFTVNKESGEGNIETRQSFKDYQLHIEWRIPEGIQEQGQAKGNSGLFLASTGKGDQGYELQILDSYNNENKTYVNGMAASIYKQFAPAANPAKKAGEWNSYDVAWTAPRFDAEGKLLSPARVTVFFNGVLVQNNVELQGETLYIGSPAYKAYDRAPIKLQSHGDPSKPISFRNIWIREL